MFTQPSGMISEITGFTIFFGIEEFTDDLKDSRVEA